MNELTLYRRYNQRSDERSRAATSISFSWHIKGRGAKSMGIELLLKTKCHRSPRRPKKKRRYSPAYIRRKQRRHANARSHDCRRPRQDVVSTLRHFASIDLTFRCPRSAARPHSDCELPRERVPSVSAAVNRACRTRVSDPGDTIS